MPNFAMGPILPAILGIYQAQEDVRNTQARTQLLNQQGQVQQAQLAADQQYQNAQLGQVLAADAQKASSTSIADDTSSRLTPAAQFVSATKAQLLEVQNSLNLAKRYANSPTAAASIPRLQAEADRLNGELRSGTRDLMTENKDNFKETANMLRDADSPEDLAAIRDRIMETQGPQAAAKFESQLPRDDAGNFVFNDATKKAIAPMISQNTTNAEKARMAHDNAELALAAEREKREEAAQRETARYHDVEANLRRQGLAMEGKRLSVALGETAGVVPPKDQDKHGEAYLETLPPSVAAEVKAIAEGRQNISAMGYRGAARSQMMEKINQYDPDFDQTAWAARSSTRRDFASGQAAKNITAINTAIGHLGTMNDLATAMQNHDVVGANKIINTVRTQLGDPAINNYGLAATAVSDELMRVFRQVGASDAEAARWEKAFKADLSTGQLKGSMGVAVKLLGSRAEALHDQWSNTMGDIVKAPEVIHPRSKEVLNKLGVKLDVGGEQPKAPATAATRQQVEARGITFEPDKYDYGIDENGNLMRRKK